LFIIATLPLGADACPSPVPTHHSGLQLLLVPIRGMNEEHSRCTLAITTRTL
jgi:hypothetical protein